MKNVSIKETQNGYIINRDGREYVYRSVDDYIMFEELIKYILGKTVKVSDR